MTLATTAFVPAAQTTAGSFYVDPIAMGRCLQAAAAFELQVVAQVHTHPGAAYHSDGDEDEANIRYPGYTSIVLPDYGAQLPTFEGAAIYFWSQGPEWLELELEDLVVIPGSRPWTKSSGI